MKIKKSVLIVCLVIFSNYSFGAGIFKKWSGFPHGTDATEMNDWAVWPREENYKAISSDRLNRYPKEKHLQKNYEIIVHPFANKILYYIHNQRYVENESGVVTITDCSNQDTYLPIKFLEERLNEAFKILASAANIHYQKVQNVNDAHVEIYLCGAKSNDVNVYHGMGIANPPHFDWYGNLHFGRNKMNLFFSGKKDSATNLRNSSWVWVMVHELMHSLGFAHTFERPDADQFICFVGDKNEIPSSWINRSKITNIDTAGLPFDEKSIMQYAAVDSDRSYKINKVVKGICTDQPIDSVDYYSRNGFSVIDISYLQKIYGSPLNPPYHNIQNTPVAAKVEMPPKVVDNVSADNIPVTPTQAVVPTPIEPTTPPQISETPETKGIAEIRVAGQSIVKSSSNAEQEEQKEAKFKSFYKKSDKCQAPDHYSRDALVGCGNEHIRARAKFEELWQQGKFKDQ